MRRWTVRRWTAPRRWCGARTWRRGRQGRRWMGWRGAVRAVASSDGLRAVGTYGELEAAEADASSLRGLGIGARVEPMEEGERGEGRGVRGTKSGMERVGVERGSRAEADCPEDPHPNPLPRGEGEGTDGPGPGEASATPHVGCPEDLSPQPSPPGEGERADAAISWGEEEGEAAALPRGEEKRAGHEVSQAIEVVRGALDPDGVFA